MKEKKINIPAILLTILLCLGIGTCVFMYLNGYVKFNSETDANMTQKTPKKSKKEIEFEDTDNAVRAVIDAIYEDAKGQMNDWLPVKTYNEGFPYYKHDDIKATTLLARSYGLYYMPNMANKESEAMADKLSNIVIANLEKIGFTKISNDYSRLQYIDKNKEIICEPGNGSPHTTNCAHVSWKISDENKKLINSLMESLKNSPEDYKYAEQFLYADVKNIKNSEGSSYQTIEAGLSDSTGLFWRKDKNSDWVFFTATQNTLSCDSYNTEDLKKSFSGYPCVMSNGVESKVSL